MDNLSIALTLLNVIYGVALVYWMVTAYVFERELDRQDRALLQLQKERKESRVKIEEMSREYDRTEPWDDARPGEDDD